MGRRSCPHTASSPSLRRARAQSPSIESACRLLSAMARKDGSPAPARASFPGDAGALGHLAKPSSVATSTASARCRVAADSMNGKPLPSRSAYREDREAAAPLPRRRDRRSPAVKTTDVLRRSAVSRLGCGQHRCTLAAWARRYTGKATHHHGRTGRRRGRRRSARRAPRTAPRHARRSKGLRKEKKSSRRGSLAGARRAEAERAAPTRAALEDSVRDRSVTPSARRRSARCSSRSTPQYHSPS